MINPYTERTMIRDINNFYGRKKEVRRLYSRINTPNPQSISIVGDRRIGKSSLLHFISHEEIRNKYLHNPENYTFVLVDLQDEPKNDIPSFIGSLLGLIKEALGRDVVLERGKEYDALTSLAKLLQRENRKLIILFDEFELITQNEVFDLNFYAFFRGLASKYDISFVTSSVRDLQELCSVKEIVNSPFFNIFTKIHLGPFSEAEARELIEKPSRAAGCPLSRYTDAILSMSGMLPLFIQITCSEFFEHIQSEGEMTGEHSIRRIEELFFEEAEPHFRHIWGRCSDDAKGVFRAILSGEEIDEEKEVVLRDLIQRGYIIEKEDEYKLFSSTFAERIVKHAGNFNPGRERQIPVTEERIQELARELMKGKPGFGDITGRCEKMKEVYRKIEMYAPSNSPVLIRGETGTGKELVAKAIHDNSRRKDKPFIAVNCSAISKEQFEAEFFGIGKRVATEVDERRGKFREAEGGTLFLDEIGEIDISTQPKLLRAIEQKEIQTVGRKYETVDVRIIAATNKNLDEAIKNGQFREDMYYRLRGFEITLPLLRERGEDILLLALHFLNAQEEPTVTAQTISPLVARALLECSWPGNVRVLKNAIKGATIASKTSKLILTDFRDTDIREIIDSYLVKLQISSLRKMKRKIAHMRYEFCQDDRKAADSLGINVRTFRSWLNEPREPDSSKTQLQILISQDSPWEQIECQVIKTILEDTQGSNPRAAGILAISLATFLQKRRRYNLIPTNP